MQYQADPALRDCPAEDAFKASIREEVGYDPFRAGAPHRLSAAFRSQPPGIRGSVTWRDESTSVRGERELYLDRDDCPEFARMLAFAIVVQLELFSDEQAVADSPPKEDPSGSAGAPSVEAPDTPDDSPYPNTSTADWANQENTVAVPDEPVEEQLALGMGPLVGFGFTSQPAIGGRGFLSVHRDWFQAELGMEASAPSVNTVAGGSGFEERLILGSLAACASSDPFAGCLVGKVGVLQIQGTRLDVARSASGLVAQTGPRFMVTQRLGSGWSAALRLELLAALVPWGITVDHTEVWTTPPLGVSVGVDLIAVVHDNTQP
jgi:hypothetical protein